MIIIYLLFSNDYNKILFSARDVQPAVDTIITYVAVGPAEPNCVIEKYNATSKYVTIINWNYTK